MIQRNDIYRYIIPRTWYTVLIEVFLRKNFGIKYYSFEYTLKVWLSMFLFPIGIAVLFTLILAFDKLNPDNYTWSGFWFLLLNFGFLTWYVFSFAFLYCAIKRHLERPKSSFIDLNKTSMYPGNFNRPLIKRGVENWTNRKIETLYEPLVFAVPGIILALCGEYLGFVFIYGAFKYRQVYKQSYKMGDEYIQGKVDYMHQQSWENWANTPFVNYHNERESTVNTKRKNVENTDEEYWHPPTS